MASEFIAESCVRGYHVYQLRWTAVIGKVLSCHREPGNASDPFAVAVMKEREIVGHVPRFYSCICNLLLVSCSQTAFFAQGAIACSISAHTKKGSGMVC